MLISVFWDRLTVKPWEEPHIRQAVCALLWVSVSNQWLFCVLCLCPILLSCVQKWDWLRRREGVWVCKRQIHSLSSHAPSPFLPWFWRLFVCVSLFCPGGPSFSLVLAVTQLCPEHTAASSFADTHAVCMWARIRHTCGAPASQCCTSGVLQVRPKMYEQERIYRLEILKTVMCFLLKLNQLYYFVLKLSLEADR